MRNGARSKTISNVKKNVQRNVNVALSPFVFRHARPPDPETDEGTFQTRRFEHEQIRSRTTIPSSSDNAV